MSELMSAEFYKLRKSVGFRVCLIVFAARDILYLILVAFLEDLLGIETTGYGQFQYLMTSFAGSAVNGMLFGFMAASLITSDYKSRDIQCMVAQGHGRAGILASKTIVYMIAIACLAFVDILIYTAGGTVMQGFGSTHMGDALLYMFRSVVCEGFVLFMMYTTCVFIAFAFTSKAASVALNILVFFFVDLGVELMPLIFKSDKLSDLLEYLPFVSVREMSEVGIDWGHAGISLVVAAAYGAAMLAATWAMFRKRDLR